MEINQDLIMQFGLMQKLSTGNSLLDALLIMLLPLVFSRLGPWLQDVVERWRQRPRSCHSRDIAHTHRQGEFFDYSDDVAPNHKLQAAVLVHLNRLPGFQAKLQAADVRLVKVPKRRSAGSSGGGLAAAVAGREDEGQRHGWDDGASSSGSSGSGGSGSSGGSGGSDSSSWRWYPDYELEEYQIKMLPPLDEWIDIEPGLEFRRSEAVAQSGSGGGGGGGGGDEAARAGSATTVTFSFRGQAAKIDTFIAAAYDTFREANKAARAAREEERYLFLPVLGDAAKEGVFTFRRYKLSDDKDFSNFWHPEKEAIISLVEAFTNKTDKFAIHGYPQKLGFLLHGPPGTGKTSFLKALATHTKRSIVSLPLSRIRTNQQLMSLMMDQRVRIADADYTLPLPHDKVIYVCEDVDAASHVVQRRASPALSALSAPQDGSQGASAAAEGGGKQGRRRGKAAAKAGGDDALLDATVAQAEAGHSAAIAALAGAARRGAMQLGGSDELNLAGLLNVLDGVVDTPGRVFVLSTNHPEKLDPALIRPGRINRKIYMGHLATNEACQMVAHYFGPLWGQQQEAALRGMWRDGAVSPAALEALCAEHDDVPGLLRAAGALVAQAAAEAGAAAAAPRPAAVAAAAGAPGAAAGAPSPGGEAPQAPKGQAAAAAMAAAAQEEEEEAAGDAAPAGRQRRRSRGKRSSTLQQGPASRDADGTADQQGPAQRGASSSSAAAEAAQDQAEGLDAQPCGSVDAPQKQPEQQQQQQRRPAGLAAAGSAPLGADAAAPTEGTAAASGQVIMCRAASCAASCGGVFDIVAVADGTVCGPCLAPAPASG